ncbi:MAG: hypothetical protein A2156_05085 [Deltaproteobacteria bacterium RBG_16_48_10]|nr:MAG: hypothetical protein A2156_05085 [Deltaproteobacteria bacterium RBG_16_48_10]
MINKGFSYVLGFILVFTLSGARASSQEQVIVSSKAGECDLTVESNEKWHTLRLRAHHPKYKGCLIDKDSMLSILNAAFSKDDSPKLNGRYSSLFIGRLIDYPWLSQYLATTAYRDRGWDSKKGKPVAMDINKYVSQLLFRRELMAQIEPVFEKGRHKVVGVTVEKVLVGGFCEAPFNQGEMHPGRVPYDAQAWFRLEKG